MKTFLYTTHSKKIMGNLHTTVSTYLKVRDFYPPSSLMGSADFHSSENSRSIISLCPNVTDLTSFIHH